jgi:hypothetical protein
MSIFEKLFAGIPFFNLKNNPNDIHSNVSNFYHIQQNHTAIGRGLQILSDSSPHLDFPKETLKAYLHFESFVQHKYDSICVSCGSEPKVLILDGNRKCSFRMSGENENWSTQYSCQKHIYAVVLNRRPTALPAR